MLSMCPLSDSTVLDLYVNRVFERVDFIALVAGRALPSARQGGKTVLPAFCIAPSGLHVHIMCCGGFQI